MNVKGFTRLFAAGAALAVLALAMPAQATYSFVAGSPTFLNGLDTGASVIKTDPYLAIGQAYGGSAGIFNSRLYENGNLRAVASLCSELGELYGSGSPVNVKRITDVVGTDWINEENRFQVAYLVHEWLPVVRKYQGLGTYTHGAHTLQGRQWAAGLQMAVWQLWLTNQTASSGNAGSVIAMNYWLADALANHRPGHGYGSAVWVFEGTLEEPPSDMNPRFQGNFMVIPEAGALQFAAFAGLGALALLRRRSRN
ncbi:MAG TPA: hypothetical protein VLH79_13630 [Chthonomonadales bacterium]|nr:hypothetical protein [Chthonomonadales bacterium]